MFGYAMEEDISNTKHIRYSMPQKEESASSDSNRSSERHLQPKKERRKKIVALTDAWSQIAETYATKESQLELLHKLHSAANDDDSNKKILLTHLKTKHSGYRAQDTEKGIYDPTRFVSVDDIVAILCHSGLSCYYCKGWTKLFYDFVRDPKQWSLERLSNKDGHNRDNVVIACLECNMRRRTMYHERYLATKQLRVNKLEPTQEDDAIH